MCFLSHYLLPPIFCSLLLFPSTQNLCLSLQNSKSCKLFTYLPRDFQTKHSRVKKCPTNRKWKPGNLSFFCYKATKLPAASFCQKVFAAHGYSLNRRKRFSLLIAWFVSCHSQTPPVCKRSGAKITLSIQTSISISTYSPNQVNL